MTLSFTYQRIEDIKVAAAVRDQHIEILAFVFLTRQREIGRKKTND